MSTSLVVLFSFLKRKKHEKEVDEGGRGGKRSEELEKERIEQHTHEHSTIEEAKKEGGEAKEGWKTNKRREDESSSFFFPFLPSLLLWLGDGRLETLKINSVNATSTSFFFFFIFFFLNIPSCLFLSFLFQSTRPAKSLISALPSENLFFFSYVVLLLLLYL